MNLYDAQGNEIEVSGGSGTPAHNLTIMCYNVQGWRYMNYAGMVRSILKKYKPDVVAMQEFNELIDGCSVYDALFSDYPYHYCVEGVSNPTAIVSKYELTDISTVLFTAQAQGGEVRGYSKAYITVNQQRICLLNTHLEVLGSDETAVRQAQAAELLNAMKEERYAICTGDFNVADCHNNESAEYIANIKPFIDNGCHSANSSDQHGFLATYYAGTSVSNYTRCECIDEIITTSNIDINMVTVDKTKSDLNSQGLPLDHLPVVAHCRVNG